MLNLLILCLSILSVQSWWWPWRKHDPLTEIPFVYYNDTTGVDLSISKKLVSELNPLAFSLLKLIVTGIKLPIPNQNIRNLATVYFDDVVCHKLRILKDLAAPGFYLGDGYVGYAIKFDAICRTRYKASVSVISPGWANLSLTGVVGNARIALNYDNHLEIITPKIDEIELTFKQVEIFVDNSRMANFVTKSLKTVFPKIASALFKQSIKNIMDSMAGQLKTMNFGWNKRYHPIFLYAPFINPQIVRLNVALVEWKGNYLRDVQDQHAQDEEDDQSFELDSSVDGDDDSQEYFDAVDDIFKDSKEML